jgi:hypothetical protein
VAFYYCSGAPAAAREVPDLAVVPLPPGRPGTVLLNAYLIIPSSAPGCVVGTAPGAARKP